MQSVLITTKAVSSNPVHCEVYSIKHYVIKFVSDLRHVGGTLGTSTNITDRHDIAEILLNVALNTIATPHMPFNFVISNSSKYIPSLIVP